MFCSLHTELQVHLSVTQSFHPEHQEELLSNQPKKFESVGFCDSSCRNPRSEKVFYFTVTHKLLLKDVEQTFTPHHLFRCTTRLDRVICMDSFPKFWSISIMVRLNQPLNLFDQFLDLDNSFPLEVQPGTDIAGIYFSSIFISF